jgi:hypothetical protein
MKTKVILLITAFFFTYNANAVNCGPTKVASIEAYKVHEGFWLKFKNNTSFIVRPDINDKGGKNVLTIAMAALAMNADVNINLSDISQCGKGGNAASWVTISIVNK